MSSAEHLAEVCEAFEAQDAHETFETHETHETHETFEPFETLNRKIIVITGPTATGKTRLGALLALQTDGEVVSADSMQIYKHMDIGTAKPTEEEKLGVPHHMIDIVQPWEEYSVSSYVSDATSCIDDIRRRGKLPVIVGGTGLYIDSLIKGHGFQARGTPALRQELSEEYDSSGGAAMLSKLSKFDPESADKLHSNDKKRIVRAFEVYATTGQTISKHDLNTKALPPRFEAVKIALTYSDRASLYRQIGKRVDAMLEKGLVSEVQTLLTMGARPGGTSMQAIGYKEIVGAIMGRYEMDEAVEKIKMESRRYAKRQLTWLRRDNSIKWFSWEDEPDVESCVRMLTPALFE